MVCPFTPDTICDTLTSNGEETRVKVNENETRQRQAVFVSRWFFGPTQLALDALRWLEMALEGLAQANQIPLWDAYAGTKGTRTAGRQLADLTWVSTIAI